MIEAQVLPIANHVKSHPGGLTYLMLNRQLNNSSEHASLSLQRMSNMPDVIRSQRMMRPSLPPHSRQVMQAKMILIRSMLFNGLANFYDLTPNEDNSCFVETLCASMVAVLLADSN